MKEKGCPERRAVFFCSKTDNPKTCILSADTTCKDNCTSYMIKENIQEDTDNEDSKKL